MTTPDLYEVNIKIKDTADGKVAVTFAPVATHIFGTTPTVGPAEKLLAKVLAFLKTLEK